MTEPTSADTILSPRAVVERVHQTALAYDMDGQADLFATDGVIEWPFAPAGVPRRLQGQAEIRSVLGAAAQRAEQAGMRPTGIHSLVMHETADPEVVIVEFEVHGEVLSTGDTFQLPYIQVFRIRDGRVVSLRDYFTAGTGDVLQQ